MSAPMLAYTHPKITRAAFLAELQWHQDQDRIISGTYEDGTDKTFRGSAVGCSLHSVKRVLKIRSRIAYGDHAQYETYLGIPQILARTQDRVFEGLRGETQKQFPLRFSAAIQERADQSGVWPKFMTRVLREIALPAVSDKHSNVRTAIARVAAGLETGWANDTPQPARIEAQSAYAAASAAYAAAAYAAYAAYAAAASAASAASAAYAAASSAADASASAYAYAAASSAADASAYADAAAAYAAAYAAASSAADASAYADAAAAYAAAYAYKKMADILCVELAAAPVGVAP